MVLPVVVAVKFAVEEIAVKVPPVASQEPDTEMVWVEVAVNVPLTSTSLNETAPPAPPVEKVSPVQTKNSVDEVADKAPFRRL